MGVGFISVGVSNEQEAVSALSDFMVDKIGWAVAEDITDTSTERDVVFSSSGEPDSGNGLTRYIRLQGINDAIFLYTYETFVNSTTYTGELFDSSYGLVTVPNDGRGVLLQAVADLERLVIHVETYNSVRYFGYVGRINSYYSVHQHNYPNIVKGGQASTYGWYYSAAERNSWMFDVDGVKAHYYAIEPLNATGLSASGPNDRNGSFVVSAPVLVRNDADPNKAELVGEPRGLYRVPREVAQHNSFLNINNDTYIVFDVNNEMMAVGPVTVSGVGVPSL